MASVLTSLNPARCRQVFGESGTWKMSTSHLISDYFDGWGYGEVTPEGFGCSYTVRTKPVDAAAVLPLGWMDGRVQVKDYSVQFNVVSKGLDSEGLGAQTALVAFCAENKLGSSRE